MRSAAALTTFSKPGPRAPAAAETRRSLQAKREGMTAAVEAAQRALGETLAPMVDDAGFNLVTTSEDVTAKSTDAIANLVEGGVGNLQVLLTLRAEGNLAVGLLNEGAGVPDPSWLQPLKERFVAAANHAEKLLARLPSATNDGSLKGITEALTRLMQRFDEFAHGCAEFG